GYTVYFWALVLAAVPTAIALALAAGVMPAVSIAGGLAVFGVVFAINSAVHSYMIVHYAESEKVAMTIGFYYTANAGGRLIGTILSGLIYQIAGLIGTLWVSAIFVAVSALISTRLAFPERRRALPPPVRPSARLLPVGAAAKPTRRTKRGPIWPTTQGSPRTRPRTMGTRRRKATMNKLCTPRQTLSSKWSRRPRTLPRTCCTRSARGVPMRS